MIGIGKGIPSIEARRKKISPPMLAIAIKPEEKPEAPPKPPMDIGVPPSPDESSEGYGGKLADDIAAAGAGRGMTPEDSKAFAADVFEAMVKCLRGGESEPAVPTMDEAEPDGE